MRRIAASLVAAGSALIVSTAPAADPMELWAQRLIAQARQDSSSTAHAVIASNARIQLGTTLAYVDEVWRTVRAAGRACDAIGFLMFSGSPDGNAYVLAATDFAAASCGVRHKPNVLYRVSHHPDLIDNCQPGTTGCNCVPGRCTAWVDRGPVVEITTPDAIQTEISQSLINQAYPGFR